MTDNVTANATVELRNEEDISSNPYLMFKYSTRAEDELNDIIMMVASLKTVKSQK